MTFCRIYNCSCENSHFIDDKSIKAIITSPPYNIKINYDEYDDKNNDYVNWLINIFKLYYHKLTDDGFIFINIADYKGHKNKSFKIINELINFGFILYDVVIWSKLSNLDFTVHRSNNYFFNCYEYIYILTKSKNTVIDLTNIKKKYDLKYSQSNIWEMKTTLGEKTNHPAIFPLELPERCISISTNKNDIVMDIFSGSGTTALACKNSQRNFIGFEISEKYIEISKNKIGVSQKTLTNDFIFNIITP
jgi:site-specific DNA-methyltransferase (adenine-specific)